MKKKTTFDSKQVDRHSWAPSHCNTPGRSFNPFSDQFLNPRLLTLKLNQSLNGHSWVPNPSSPMPCDGSSCERIRVCVIVQQGFNDDEEEDLDSKQTVE